MRTIAVVNQKGGCGKTTTAISLSATFARRGVRTLLVDMDPQSHCAAGLGVPESRIEFSIGDAMAVESPESIEPSTLVWEVARDLHLAPSTMRLAALEAPGGGIHERVDRDRRLERVLSTLCEAYELCLIDCPPTIGLLTFNALRAAREVIVPVETGYFALKGAQKQWETIQRVIRRIGRPIACHVLPTLHDPESELACDILAALRRQFAGQIVPRAIHAHAELREAASLGQAVSEHAPDSAASRDYAALADWLLEQRTRPDPATLAERVSTLDIEVMGRPVTSVRATTALGTLAGDDEPVDGGRAGELVERLRALAASAPGAAAVRAPMPPPPTTTLVPSARGAPSIPGRPIRIRPLTASQAGVGEPPRAPARPVAGTPDARSSIATVTVPAPSSAAGPVVEPGVTVRPDGVHFRQPDRGQQTIHIAGDFNHWRHAATPMRHNAACGAHEACLDLPPGRYRYRLIVDGRWQADPHNPCTEQNEHGEANSVLEVPLPPSSSPAPGTATALPAEPCPRAEIV